MEELKEGKVYSIDWVDGDYKTNCEFKRKHRGFLVFVDENKMKVICKPSSIRQIKEQKI